MLVQGIIRYGTDNVKNVALFVKLHPLCTKHNSDKYSESVNLVNKIMKNCLDRYNILKNNIIESISENDAEKNNSNQSINERILTTIMEKRKIEFRDCIAVEERNLKEMKNDLTQFQKVHPELQDFVKTEKEKIISTKSSPKSKPLA